jgi:hypothetical protein
MKSDDIILAVRNVVENDRAKIDKIMTSLTGGWEGWLQVESALGLISALGIGATAAREQLYPAPDNAFRCDLLLTPAKGIRAYLELKVQNSHSDNILARFSADVDKVRALSESTRKAFPVVATAYMVEFDATALRTYSQKMAGHVKVQQWDGAKWNDSTAAPVSHRPTLASYKLDL